MAGKTSKTKATLRFVGLILLGGILYAGWRFGPAIVDFYKAGLFDSVLSPRELRKYQGTSIDNLRAMYTAMNLYHESEGQFPNADGWMDALKPYWRTDDMAEKEALKKFVNPLVQPSKEGVYGYAMNDAASAKYKDDVSNGETTPLIFDSSQTGWNAHGKPEKLLPKPERQGGNLAVSITGQLLKYDEKGVPRPLKMGPESSETTR